jgi:hypothetical protein
MVSLVLVDSTLESPNTKCEHTFIIIRIQCFCFLAKFCILAMKNKSLQQVQISNAYFWNFF